MNDGSQPEGTLPEGDNMGEDRSSGPTPVESSDSKIAWCTIIFMLLGVLFIVFCGILLVLCLQKRRRPQEVATTTTAITEAAAMTTTTSKGEDPEARAGSIVDVHLANEDASASNDNFWAFMIMAVSAMAALSLSIVTHTSCEYMDVDNEYDSDFSSIGLWSVALTYDGSTGTGGDDTCYSNVVRNVDGRDEFEDFDVNTALQIARVAGIIATTLGGIFFVLELVLGSSSTYFAIRKRYKNRNEVIFVNHPNTLRGCSSHARTSCRAAAPRQQPTTLTMMMQ
eukprot:scaffold2501_cov174-Amphora_coffeaeformis.AAC.20